MDVIDRMFGKHKDARDTAERFIGLLGKRRGGLPPAADEWLVMRTIQLLVTALYVIVGHHYSRFGDANRLQTLARLGFFPPNQETEHRMTTLTPYLEARLRGEMVLPSDQAELRLLFGVAAELMRQKIMEDRTPREVRQAQVRDALEDDDSPSRQRNNEVIG